MGDHEHETRHPDHGVGAPVRSVFFNDGTNPNVFALVTKNHGGPNPTLDLLVVHSEGVEVAKSIGHREPSDYGPEGGGRSWHESAI